MTPAAALITDPLNWLYAYVIAVVVSLATGRRDRYEPFHYDVARAAGRELPRNLTRRISLNDALQLPSMVMAPAAGLMAYLLPAPALWLVAAGLGVVFALTAWRSMTEFRSIARRDGIELQSAHGGAAGAVLVMVGIVLFTAVVVWVFFVAIW